MIRHGRRRGRAADPAGIGRRRAVTRRVGPEGLVDSGDLWERRLRRHIAATLGRRWVLRRRRGRHSPRIHAVSLHGRGQQQTPVALRRAVPGPGGRRGHGGVPVRRSRVAQSRIHRRLSPQVTDDAHRRGAASVISFIDPTNKGALFVNHLAGFQAHAVRRTKLRLLRRTYSFEDWPADTSRSLLDVASGRVR